MNQKVFLFCILASLTAVKPATGFLTWLFGERSPELDNDFPVKNAGIMEGKTQFEMQTADEKFLLEANFVKDLSPLDVCHQTVFLSIIPSRT